MDEHDSDADRALEDVSRLPLRMRLFSSPVAMVVFVLLVSALLAPSFWVRVPLTRGVVIGFEPDDAGTERAYLAYQTDRIDFGFVDDTFPKVTIRQVGRRSGLGLQPRRQSVTSAKPRLLLEVLSRSDIELTVEDGQGTERTGLWSRDGRPELRPMRGLDKTLSPEELALVEQVLSSARDPVSNLDEDRLAALLKGAEAVLRQEGFDALADAVGTQTLSVESMNRNALAATIVVLLGLPALIFGSILLRQRRLR